MRIEVYNDWDHVPKAYAEGKDQVTLAWDGEYRKGDVIRFSGLEPGLFYAVQADAALGEALCLIDAGEVLYPVPFYERKTSYNPLAFWGNRHLIRIRRARDFETAAYRNLALNPFDQHDVPFVYPHASANVETRGEAVFEARNAIDGVIATRSHGEWPYESWGINRNPDARFRLDFGRRVDIDEIRLYTRADFPHDSYWVSGEFTFSDGTRLVMPLEKKVEEPQILSGIRVKGVTWLELGNLRKAEDESPFPALTQIEVYGRDSRAEQEGA